MLANGIKMNIKSEKLKTICYYTKYYLKKINITCSRTSRKPRPKMHENKTWSLTGGGRLQESNHMGPLPRRGSGTCTSWKIIYCMRFLSYAMCISMLSLKVLSYIQSSTAHTVNIEIREYVKWSLSSG